MQCKDNNPDMVFSRLGIAHIEYRSALQSTATRMKVILGRNIRSACGAYEIPVVHSFGLSGMNGNWLLERARKLVDTSSPLCALLIE
eukprot:2651894-Amphidinium_carterae.1